MDRERVREVAEVVVRFAETIVDLAHVAPGDSYRAGTVAGVDLALDLGAPSQIVVESTPAGFVVHAHPRAPALLQRAAPIVLAHGHATITVTLVASSAAPLPRVSLDRRPVIFTGVSLGVHAIVWLLAIWLVDPDPFAVPGTEVAVARRPTKIARFAAPAQTVKQLTAPPPEVVPITTDDTPSPDPALDVASPVDAKEADPGEAHTAGLPPGQSTQHLAVAPGDAVLDDRPGAPPQTGEGQRFDPTSNPDFDTVKTGRFATVATGRDGGEQYQLAGASGRRKPLIVVSCDAASCLILGGDPASGVREKLQERLDEIVACYRAAPEAGGKKVELDFGIDTDGRVDAVEVGGVGDIGSCVSQIIKSLEFERT